MSYQVSGERGLSDGGEGGQITINDFDPTLHSADEITALLHRSYKKLLAMGLHFLATAQTSETTLRRLTSGRSFVAQLGRRIVGTVSYYDDSPDHTCPWYAKANVARFGQFAVEPELQKTGIGAKLLAQVESLAKARGREELSLDTSERALHLIEYYQKKGFRAIGFVQWHQVNYRSVILSKSLAQGERPEFSTDRL